MVGLKTKAVSKSKNTTETITFYLEEIPNNTTDQTITTDMIQYVTQFFSNYDSLRSKNEAQYYLSIVFEEFNITAATISSSGEAVTLNLVVVYSFKVSNASGKILYRKKIPGLQVFSPGESSYEYSENMEEAFIDVTEDIMSEFKNDFEASRN